jgi:hypothetical protein
MAYRPYRKFPYKCLTSASKAHQGIISICASRFFFADVGKVDNTRCPACREDEEDTKHYLLRCQAYAHERWPLIQHAIKKCKPLTLQTALGDPQLTLLLAAYIHATGRFTRSGECSMTQTGNTAQSEVPTAEDEG